MKITVTITIILLSCLYPLRSGLAAESENISPSAEAALRELKKEKTIVDISYDPSAPIQWTIGVYDNKTPRHGYAQYVCEVLAENNIIETHVRVVDIIKVHRGEDFRKSSLGHVNCSTREIISP